ncbi:MAG: hypothetical protein ACAH95_16635 [Fimbriimonas sp.]
MNIKAFQSIVYLQIRRRWLSVRVLTWSGGDFCWHGPAEIFITADSKGQPTLMSPEAARTNPTLVGRFFTAFAHPRAFIDGFDETRALIKFYIRESGYKTRSKKLIFLVHLRDDWEGGLSDVESRALVDICRQCGASEVRMADQPTELTPPQVLEIARS